MPFQELKKTLSTLRQRNLARNPVVQDCLKLLIIVGRKPSISHSGQNFFDNGSPRLDRIVLSHV
jgi:hypothetical protein